MQLSCLDDDIRTCRCSCVLLDVGLNNGDTLRTWHTTAAAALLKDGFTNASAAFKGYPRSGAFAIASHGKAGLAQSMARELGPEGIHVVHCPIDAAIGQ